MPDSNQAEFEAWVDDLPNAIHLIIIQRACSDLGSPATLNANGSLGVDEDLFNSEELEQAMHKRYLQRYVDEILDELVADEKIKPDAVDPDSGEIIYALVDDYEG